MGTGLPLLERERELARVDQLIGDAAAGTVALAVVEGPAGAGKSAILDALVARASDWGLRVLRATGLELEAGYPFGIVRQLFEPAMYSLDPADRREVFAGAAGLAEELLAGRGAESGPRLIDPGFALLHSLYWALVGLSDLGPVALVVDDVQWADPLSLRFLAFALKRSEGLSLLVALACRDLPAGEQPGELASVLSVRASVIRPARLSRDAVGLLLARVAGSELDADTIAEAERITQGNPLYVHELADSLASAGEAAGKNAPGMLGGAAPAAVGRRVGIAVAQLDGASQAIARAAAILGDDVPLWRASRLAEVEQKLGSGAADALARAGVLLAAEPLRFRHPLVREAVLDSIEPRALAALHGRAARHLIAEGEPAERAAVHLLQSDPAGDPDVVATLRTAAHNLNATAAPEQAIRALRRALREPPVRAELPVVLMQLATAEYLAGNQDALGHFEEAFGSGSSLEQLAEGAVTYAVLLIVQGRFSDAEALMGRVFDAIGERERRLRLEAEFGGFAIAMRVPSARARLARIAAGLPGHTPAERQLLALRAADALNAGEISAAAALQPVTRVLADHSLRGYFGPDSPMLIMLLVSLLICDEPDVALPLIDTWISEARRRGAAGGLAIATFIRGAFAWRRGELERAEADARTAIEIYTQIGSLAGFPFAVHLLVEVLNEAGRLAEADRLLNENDWDGQLPERRVFIEMLGARGRLRLSQGRSEEAVRDLEAQWAWLDQAGDARVDVRARAAVALVPMLLRADRREHARQLAEQTLRLSERVDVPRYIGYALRARALAGSGEAPLEDLHAAAAIFEQIGAQLDLARTLLDTGRVLRRDNQPAAAREPLRRALDLARARGADPLAQHAEHELRAAGARPRRDRITGRDALTATERRVAELAIDGMTNRQIAETLFVTRKTVESHLEHIFRKLDIHARGELAQALASQDEVAAVT